MDVVVANIQAKFGILISRSWSVKLKGTLQMDMSYATIPVFEEMRRLYRETRLTYMESCKEHPNNHHIYVVDTDLGSSIFFNDLCCETEEDNVKMIRELGEDENEDQGMKPEIEGMWNMHFDGATSKEGDGVGVWVISPNNKPTLHSFKLVFDCTNNVVEYETLMLGLNIIKEKKANKITVHRYYELIINQVNGLYQTKRHFTVEK